MSIRAWMRYASALTFQLLALGLALNIIYTALRGAIDVRNYWHEQHEIERNQTAHAAEIIASQCSVSDAPRAWVAECISEAVDRYVESEHSDQDLQAQKDMAYWAQLLFWLTVVGSTVSVVGLWLLFVSLRHTRIAISDSREIGEAQVRAYLSLDTNEGKTVLQKFSAGEIPQVEFVTKNSGNSPALKHRYAAGVAVVDMDFPTHNGDLVAPIADGPEPNDVLPSGDTATGESVNGAAITADQIRQIVLPQPSKKLAFFGVLLYEDVFRKPRRTRFCLELRVVESKAKNGSGAFKYTWVKTAYHNDAD
ncbi:hypothetical protein [Pseudooceanicola sp.]|uniref:hypothetical protein n=1 Tax=Pseudooceanicola sp. TaxID=1914328 RepID=UPI002612FAD8|nr:hypothetical protein [Pseudooceanicola sp.]MDF1857066.1 hypothetical protein [Pseudooceanicola sp.]